MKCHFYKDPKSGEKFLIPYCMQVVHSNDITDCTCAPTRLKCPCCGQNIKKPKD